MLSLLITAHILGALAIVVLVLIQQGRGGTGALGGGAASQTFFGSRGSFSLLAKITAGLAIFFFVTTLGLSMIARQQLGGSGIDQGIIREQQQSPEPTLPTFDNPTEEEQPESSDETP